AGDGLEGVRGTDVAAAADPLVDVEGRDAAAVRVVGEDEDVPDLMAAGERVAGGGAAVTGRRDLALEEPEAHEVVAVGLPLVEPEVGDDVVVGVRVGGREDIRDVVLRLARLGGDPAPIG